LYAILTVRSKDLFGQVEKACRSSRDSPFAWMQTGDQPPDEYHRFVIEDVCLSDEMLKDATFSSDASTNKETNSTNPRRKGRGQVAS